MFFQRTQQSKLEARLKRGRPLPEDELVDEIVSYIEPDRPVVRTRGLRVAFVAATVGVAVALATFGGVTYAASGVEHAAVAVKHVFVAKKPRVPQSRAPRWTCSTRSSPARLQRPTSTCCSGITPLQALTSFSQYVIEGEPGPAGRTGLRREAQSPQSRLHQPREYAEDAPEPEPGEPGRRDREGRGSSGEPAGLGLGTPPALQLQQQQKLETGQAARRSACANATYKAAHTSRPALMPTHCRASSSPEPPAPAAPATSSWRPRR